MSDIEIAFIKECRKFYDENGYLPHKMADALISIAEKIPDEKYRRD